MNQPPSTDAGQQLGRYKLLAPLGEGGMAKVFVALKKDARQICVLKQLHIQLEEQKEAVIRFTREAHIASLLRHENIAGISDAGVEGDKFCIVMEFIAGETVEALVRAAARHGGVIPIEVTIPIMLATLDGLAYAHDLENEEGKPLKLVHRDLSPRNIMLAYSGEVKVIDFGIAKGDVDEYKTAAGALMGTPYYMSPEQARAVPLDHRSDLYTVAAVLFEMLAGRRLVRAKGRAKILMTVAREKAPLIRSLNPDVPEALEAVLAKALEKKPDDRYPTARAFKAALSAAAGSLSSTPRERLGKFIKSVFPDGEARANEYIALGQQGASGPAAEATRVAMTSEDGNLIVPSALSSPSSADRTRTGFLDPVTAEASDVGLPTRTGVVASPAPATPSTPMIQPLPGAEAPQQSQSSTFQSRTFGDTHDPYSSSRSHLTGTRQTSVVQKIGVGFTLLLLCIVGYVGYGQLSSEVVLPDREVVNVEPPPTEPSVKAVAAPRVVEPPTKVPARAPPPPTSARRTPRSAPTKAAVEPPPPAAPPARRGLRARLAEVKTRPQASALIIKVQNVVDRFPDGTKKDIAQAALDRAGRNVKVSDMADAIDDALAAIGR